MNYIYYGKHASETEIREYEKQNTVDVLNTSLVVGDLKENQAEHDWDQLEMWM